MAFDADGAMARYLELQRARPDLFRNAPGGIEILVERASIEAARKQARTVRAAAGQDTRDLRAGLLAHDPYMTIVRDAVRFPDGALGLHNRIVERRSVAALPLLDENPVIIRTFRHGLRDWSLEFPRGAVDAGESHEDAIRRELKEEIGANVLELASLGDFTPGGSSLSIISTLFVARIDGIGAPQQAEAIAEIRVVPVAELEDLIVSGKIIDGFTLSLFARARLRGLL